MTHFWEVVGGADKGGIIVREGPDLDSSTLPERLSTKSLVRELALVEGRLHYELMDGCGPTSGWVSVKVKRTYLVLLRHDSAVEAQITRLDGTEHVLRVRSFTTVAEVKEQLEKSCNIPWAEQCLLAGNSKLDEAEMPFRHTHTGRVTLQLLRVPSHKAIFVIGGSMSPPECFHPAWEAWKSLPPMIDFRANCHAAALNGTLLAFGGFDLAGNAFSASECFDPHVGQWQRVPSMLQARERTGAVVLRKEIYVVGGWCHGKALAKVERFSATSSQWESLESLRQPRDGCMLLVLNGLIYAIGGRGNKNCLRSVECYTPELDAWAGVAPMISARQSCTGVTLGGKLYVAGGYYKGRFLSSAECYDAALNQWIALPSLQKERRSCTSVVLNGCWYVVGGSANGCTLPLVERFNTSSAVWEVLPNMQHSRESCMALAFNGELYVFGGYTGGNGTVENGFKLSSSAECFDPASGTWRLIASMSVGRAKGTAVAI